MTALVAALLAATTVGALIALVGVSLGRRRQRKHELVAARRALAVAADWWWRTDASLAVTEVQPGQRQPAGVDSATLLGRKLWQWHADAPVPEVLRAALDSRAPFFDILIQDPAARTQLVLSLSGAPVFAANGQFAGYSGIAREVSALLQCFGDASAGDRAALVRQGDAFAQRSRQLELATRDLDSFAYSVSHDLRAPLRVIDGFATIVQEDYGSRLDDLGREHLRRIVAAAARMNEMIDTLLSLAKMTSRELTLERVDLSSLAHEVADELNAPQGLHAAPRQVQFVIAPGLSVEGDRTLLRMVLQNLLANAHKFTSQTTAARIEFGAQLEADGTVFQVRDNGAGFDMRFADKLFGPFQRFHSQHEFPGTGVGLATVQRIVRKHGGRIWAQSAPGQGATFFFRLWERG